MQYREASGICDECGETSDESILFEFPGIFICQTCIGMASELFLAGEVEEVKKKFVVIKRDPLKLNKPNPLNIK